MNDAYRQAYQQSLSEPEVYWREKAKEIEWFEFPKEILSQDDKGSSRWYKGGKLNTSYLCLDHHIDGRIMVNKLR